MKDGFIVLSSFSLYAVARYRERCLIEKLNWQELAGGGIELPILRILRKTWSLTRIKELQEILQKKSPNSCFYYFFVSITFWCIFLLTIPKAFGHALSSSNLPYIKQYNIFSSKREKNFAVFVLFSKKKTLCTGYSNNRLT